MKLAGKSFRKGLSIIELVVSITVLFLASSFLMGMFLTASAAPKRLDRGTRLEHLAATKMDEILVAPLGTVPSSQSGDFSEEGYGFTISSKPCAFDGDMLAVKVTATGPDGQRRELVALKPGRAPVPPPPPPPADVFGGNFFDVDDNGDPVDTDVDTDTDTDTDTNTDTNTDDTNSDPDPDTTDQASEPDDTNPVTDPTDNTDPVTDDPVEPVDEVEPEPVPPPAAFVDEDNGCLHCHGSGSILAPPFTLSGILENADAAGIGAYAYVIQSMEDPGAYVASGYGYDDAQYSPMEGAADHMTEEEMVEMANWILSGGFSTEQPYPPGEDPPGWLEENWNELPGDTAPPEPPGPLSLPAPTQGGAPAAY